MAELIQTVQLVVPLTGYSYIHIVVWKLRSVSDDGNEAGLWSIVNGMEKAPEAEADAEVIASPLLAITMHWHTLYCLSIPTLPYLLGDLHVHM